MKSLVSILALCFLSIIGTKAAGRNLKDVVSLPSQQYEDPYRTGYHFQPPSNWMNDPNGPMIYKGVYHLFYQYNPCNATFGDLIIWGHAVSHDLVNWTHLDPAIYPTHDDNRTSYWSGSATIIENNTIPMMVYTGSDPKLGQVQDHAQPKNLSDPFLTEWVKCEDNTIMAPEDVDTDCFRDPSTAWQGPDGVWRMVVGAEKNDSGMAFLYKSTDFKTWKRSAQPLSSAEATGTWECPDFYPVSLNSNNGLDTSAHNGSVMHVMKAGFEGHDWYTIGTYTPDRENFLPQNGLKLSGSKLDLRYDYGNFYASKSFFDDSKNRRVLWGWIPESDSEEDDIGKGWAGLQSFPRAVWMDERGNQLIQWPVKEIEALRQNEVKLLENITLNSANRSYEILDITASQADIMISFNLEGLTKEDAEELDTTSVDPQELCTERGASSNGAFGPFGLLAMVSQDREEQTAIFFRVFYHENNINGYSVLMCSDLSSSTVRSSIDKTSYGAFVDIDLEQNNYEISLRNLIDHSIIESFAEEGKTCITSRVYPKFAKHEDARLFAFNYGTRSVTISKMSAWSMRNATFENKQTENYSEAFCNGRSLSL